MSLWGVYNSTHIRIKAALMMPMIKVSLINSCSYDDSTQDIDDDLSVKGPLEDDKSHFLWLKISKPLHHIDLQPPLHIKTYKDTLFLNLTTGVARVSIWWKFKRWFVQVISSPTWCKSSGWFSRYLSCYNFNGCIARGGTACNYSWIHK